LNDCSLTFDISGIDAVYRRILLRKEKMKVEGESGAEVDDGYSWFILSALVLAA
jgi:hypothetical protein